MTPVKQTVYLPVKVEEGLDTHSSTNGKGEKLTYVNEDIKAQNAYSHWLKRGEAFVFTPEQLNEYTANVIKQALETAAEKAKIPQFKSRFLTIQENKQSITNTFEETFKKFEV